MAAKSYDPYGAVPRPKPSTWQEGQEQGAQDLWNQQYPTLAGAEAGAEAGKAGAITRSGSAFDRIGSYTPAATKAYNPSEQAAFDPSQFYTGVRGGAATAALARGGAVPQVGGAGALEAFHPSAEQNFSSADVSNFDPSEYGSTFAKGAYGEFSQNLNRKFEDLTTKNAGTGRLRSGWFDRDRGRAAVEIGGDFNNKLAQAATTFSAQRLQAVTGGADLRFRAAAGVDAGNLSRAQGMDANAIAASGANAGNALARMKLGADTALGEESLGANMAGDQARLALSRAQGIDTGNLTRAHDMDSLTLQAHSTGLSSALESERMARADANTAADRTGSYVSANREWAGSDRQTQDERDYQAAMAAYRKRQAFRVGTSYTDPADRAGQKAALAAGVPWRG